MSVFRGLNSLDWTHWTPIILCESVITYIQKCNNDIITVGAWVQMVSARLWMEAHQVSHRDCWTASCPATERHQRKF